MANEPATGAKFEDGTTLHVRNDLAELERIGEAVAALGARCGWPHGVARDLELALDEVVTNIISYAYEDAAVHGIDIRIVSASGVVRVEITDDGRPFDPTLAPEAVTGGEIRERPIGGLGWHLVRTVVDSLAYRREQGCNIVTMTRHTQQPAAT